MIKTALITLFLMVCIASYSQHENKLIRKGNKNYKDSLYNESEINYRKALEKAPQSLEATFNLGDALYKQKKYEEATKKFSSLCPRNIDKKKLAKIYHNLGNSLLQQSFNINPMDTTQNKIEMIKQSIEAYKNALRNNPDDKETKYNLAYAQRFLRQQIQQQKQQQQQQNKNQQKKQNKKQEQQKQQEKKKQQQEQQKKQEQQKNKISKKDAERMLKSLQDDEKKLQQKLRMKKLKSQKKYIEKDW